MTFTEIRASLTNRVASDGRGDRGWWLVTRVHLTHRRLVTMAQYIHTIAGSAPVTLQNNDFLRLGAALGIQGSNPGITIRRHYMLAMVSPLRLIARLVPNRWHRVQLTDLGRELATKPDPHAVLEVALRDIVWAKDPWFTPTRQAQYPDFDIRPYETLLSVLPQVDGYLTRDEYDLFVSRIRHAGEAPSAIESCRAFRSFRSGQQDALLRIASDSTLKAAGKKAVQNWRDQALHTFSLFALGQQLVRQDDTLRLTDTLVTPHSRQSSRPSTSAVLKIPTPSLSAALERPPLPPLSNPGNWGEEYIAKLLTSQGWRVTFYTNQRGLGFDLWATSDSSNMVIEVKSSLGRLGAIVLTPLEYQAAQHYGANYVIAVVENVATLPTVAFVVDPVRSVPNIRRVHTDNYSISRADWERAVSVA